MYSVISKSYNGLYGEEQLKKAELISNNFIFNDSCLLLDVGCGTGISSTVFSCRKIGLDKELSLLKQADFPVVCGVSEALPFKNKSFDAAVSLTAIHNFSDYCRALSEIKNVSKKNVIISILKKSKLKNDIIGAIKSFFNIYKIVDEEKDIILFANI